MCGIAGEFRFDNKAPDAAAMDRMLAMLARRGPDAEGQHVDGSVRLGHRRLAIIDLSEHSKQPMLDAASGTALVFNGTLYNYPELRVELIGRGHVFHSDGDTEVILRAFLEWGEACVERLHGMFAFAIWNRETLFLARDRLGIKPLYYSQNLGCFRFASTPQALQAAGGVDTSVDAVALHHLFTLHAVVPAPRTIFNGVRKLAPGTTMTVNARGEFSHRKYWSLKAQRPAVPKTEAEWTEAIHESLRQAVKKRIEIADVKVGVLLSGGLDSSLLVALLAEQGVPDLMTFSVGFEDQPEERGNEFEYSDPVAAMYGTRHHKYLIPNAEVLRRLPEAVDQMSEPMFAQDAVAFYLLTCSASR
jgi:asparagine synthase (glutamine-hydrolysing)